MSSRIKTAAAALLGVLVLAGCTSGTEESLPRGETVTENPNYPGGKGPPATDSPADDPTPDEAKEPAYPQTADLREVDLPISPQDAIEAAHESGSGELHSISLDFSESDSAWVYEVTLIDGSNEQDFDIDAVEGTVIETDSDATDDTSQVITWGEPMKFTEALELATGEVNEPLRGWSYEIDDGALRYEFEFGPPRGTVDVTVDAETGGVARD